MAISRRLLVSALVASLASPVVGGEFMNDQAQRDLVRIFSQVYQRALSYSAIGTVVRPRLASPAISLGEPLHPAWLPSCSSPIRIVPADSAERPLALVLVPTLDVSRSGAAFIAYAIHAGPTVLTTELLVDPPDWLVAEIGGYASIADELSLMLSRSEVTIETVNCSGFTYAAITGAPR